MTRTSTLSGRKTLLLSCLRLSGLLNATPIERDNGHSGVANVTIKVGSILDGSGSDPSGLAKRTGGNPAGPAQPQAGPYQSQAGPAHLQAGQAQAPPTFDLTTVTPTSPEDLTRRVLLGYNMFDQIMFADSGEEVARIIQAQNLNDFDDPILIDKDWQSDERSVTTYHARSAEWYWTHMEHTAADCNISPITTALQRSGLMTTFPPFHCYVWTQDQSFYPNPENWGFKSPAKLLNPTMAVEKFAYNIEEDAIVILQSESPLAAMYRERDNGRVMPAWIDLDRKPASRITGELPAPPLNIVADIIDKTIRILQKAHSPLSGRSSKEKVALGRVASLKTIVYQSISGPRDTLEVIKAVLLHFAPSNDNQLKAWPGHAFEVGSAAFDALIATMTFRDVAWYTAQRKRTFGKSLRAAVKVTIFQGDTDRTGTPSLLWELDDVDENMVIVAGNNHQRWVQSQPSGDILDAVGSAPYAPNPMRSQMYKLTRLRPLQPKLTQEDPLGYGRDRRPPVSEDPVLYGHSGSMNPFGASQSSAAQPSDPEFHPVTGARRKGTGYSDTFSSQRGNPVPGRTSGSLEGVEARLREARLREALRQAIPPGLDTGTKRLPEQQLNDPSRHGFDPFRWRGIAGTNPERAALAGQQAGTLSRAQSSGMQPPILNENIDPALLSSRPEGTIRSNDAPQSIFEATPSGQDSASQPDQNANLRPPQAHHDPFTGYRSDSDRSAGSGLQRTGTQGAQSAQNQGITPSFHLGGSSDEQFETSESSSSSDHELGGTQ